MKMAKILQLIQGMITQLVVNLTINFQESYKLIATVLSKQKVADADPKTIQKN